MKMKNIGKLLVALGVCILLTFFAVSPEIEIQPEEVESIEMLATYPVIYEASVLDSILSLFKDLDFSSILNLLLTGGLVSIIASFRKIKKELMDIPERIRQAKANDGKIDEQEALGIAKEVEEFIAEVTKFWYMITAIFKKVRKVDPKE
jgi:hypothetical protein